MGKLDDAVALITNAKGGVGMSDAECDRIALEIKSVLCRRKPCSRCKNHEAKHDDTSEEKGDVAKVCTRCYSELFKKEPSREIPFKMSSLSTLYAQVRTRYFDASKPPAAYATGVKTLKRMAKNEPGLAPFLHAPPEKQRKLLRDPTPEIINPQALEVYKSLSVEVPITKRLRLTQDENNESKRLQTEARQQQQTDGRRTINDVQRYIVHCAEQCRAFAAAEAHPCCTKLSEAAFAHEIEAAWLLLFVTGRRMSEITSGWSSFTPVPDNPHSCVFHGQLKKTEAAPFCIQTILPYDMWHPLYAYYFAPRRAETVAVETESGRAEALKKLNTKWAPKLRVRVHRLFGVKTHCLRDIYTVVAYHIFHHHAHISFPLFQQKMLGHQAAAETVAYNKPNVVTNTIKTSFPQHRITITMDEGCYTTQLPPTVQGY